MRGHSNFVNNFKYFSTDYVTYINENNVHVYEIDFFKNSFGAV